MKKMKDLCNQVIQNIQTWLRSILKKYQEKKRKESELSSSKLSEIILVLLLSLKSGTTLDESIKYAIPATFLNSGLQGIESVRRAAKLLNDKEFYRLTMLLNQYHKNGSESTFQALQKFYDELCFHQTAEIKKKAEQATIKLTLLLMLSLLSVILMIMAPVIMMLKH